MVESIQDTLIWLIVGDDLGPRPSLKEVLYTRRSNQMVGVRQRANTEEIGVVQTGRARAGMCAVIYLVASNT
jgi:hypothetical protein